jgi:hypothetical protein
MFWGMTIFLGSALVLLCSLSALLQATISRTNNCDLSAARLGVVGFALILSGAVVLDVRGNVYMRAGQFFLDDFGWLLVISGLIYLFILLCANRTNGVTRTAGKGNATPENTISEFLK